RWLRKLQDPRTRLVVVDPIPDPFAVAHADLIVPSPPHSATTKVYQNGEWKMSLSVPHKQAAPETRSDVTIIYDVMAAITRRLGRDPQVAAPNPALARHARSGYLRRRFLDPAEPQPETATEQQTTTPDEVRGGLPRIDGEVSRPVLWARLQAYMSGGQG